MSDITRRETFRFLTAGAAFGAVATSQIQPAAATIPQPAAPATRAALQAVQRQASGLALPERNAPCLATVLHCRSFRREVYLYVSEQVHGFVTLTPEAHALAAACQAAGRPVAVCYWGHQPDHDGGAGRFHGALLALSPDDLPDESTNFAC